jgi:hypothetical protein
MHRICRAPVTHTHRHIAAAAHAMALWLYACTHIRPLHRCNVCFHACTHACRTGACHLHSLIPPHLHTHMSLSLSQGTMVAGWDPTGPALYYVDSDGQRTKGKVFSVGSGSLYAYGVLDSEYKWCVCLGYRAYVTCLLYATPLYGVLGSGYSWHTYWPALGTGWMVCGG